MRIHALSTLVGALLAVGCVPAAPLEASGLGHVPIVRDELALHFAGDVYFGEAYRSALSNAPASKRYERSLARLRPVLLRAPVIANLESTLTRSTESDFDGRKSYLHWSAPDATAAALARTGFAGLSLGNNHAMDYGLPALEETRTVLQRRGLTPFGAGSDRAQAREPYSIELSARGHNRTVAVIGAYWYRPHYDHRYRFYANADRGGVRRLGIESITAQIHELKQRAPNRTVVLFPHWGRNYRWRTQRQRKLAHALIDAGADFVIGHGAHSYQEIERYRDRWILYGLGNLVFLTPGRYQQNHTPPFSLLATMRWLPRAGELEQEVVLRFIASDNRQTDYQPHLVVDDDTFRTARDTLQERSCLANDFCHSLATGKDDLGPYLRLPLSAADR